LRREGVKGREAKVVKRKFGTNKRNAVVRQEKRKERHV
jgi:hypothetical protein